MTVTIVQFDNRPPEQLGLMLALAARNRAYAERHGYHYQFVRGALFDLPVYWQKPALCREFLTRGSDVVAWLDTDAVLHDHDRRIENLFLGDEAMVGAGDNPYWDTPFNAGVFFARGPEGAEIMARWAALFAGTAWRRTETAWICEDEWAGPSYEQGAFNLHLMKPLQQAGRLRLADWSELQSPFPNPRAFTLHFPGPFRVNLPAYLGLTAPA